MNSAPTFTIRTLGCKANQYDSQLLREDLFRRGFVECQRDGGAAVCIINTCTVTAQSDAKSRQAIRALKRQNPDSCMVVTGCYAHMNPQEVSAIPGVDVVAGNPSKETLADRICALLNLPQGFTGPPPPGITFFSGHTRAFVKIQDGCNKRCSYCIVRFARGTNRSRPIPEILTEVEGLVSNGYREIVLTGIHIGSFGMDHGEPESRLPELIESLRGIGGLIRIRLSSIDPNEITEGLIQSLQNSPQVCHHLHVPLQSGSDAILRKMNRDYTRHSYLQTIALLRAALPAVSISADVMVGFPGETDDDFLQTRRVVSEAEFSKVHIFPFSSRPGTPADKFRDCVPPKVIGERGAVLAGDARAAALKVRQRFRGQIVEVLVERELGCRDPNRIPQILKDAGKAYEGFTSNYLRTVLMSNGEDMGQLKNRIVQVRVEDCDDRHLYGRQVRS